MNFNILLYIVLPYNIALSIDLKLSSKITIEPASLATSVPDPIANPTSALFKAGASFTPSPVIPHTRFSSCASLTILDLSVGNALAITLKLGIIALTSSSLILFNSSEVKAISLPDFKSPASFDIATAVSFLSPVIITTWTPAFWTSSIAFLASGLTSSLIPTKPMITKSSGKVSSINALSL